MRWLYPPALRHSGAVDEALALLRTAHGDRAALGGLAERFPLLS